MLKIEPAMIIATLQKQSAPMRFTRLARLLKISHQDNKLLSRMISTLVENNQIFKTKDGLYYLTKVLKSYEGIIRITSKGFGFVDQEITTVGTTEKQSVFIPMRAINGALDKDVVKIEVYQDPLDATRYYGVVVEIVQQNRSVIVGTVVKYGRHWGLKAFDRKINAKFRFKDTSQLEEDYEIVANIIGTEKQYTLLEWTKTLGHKDEAKMDIEAAIADANVPYEWDRLVLQQLATFGAEVTAQDCKNRTDLRARLIVTIDGNDSKDFDDAIEVSKLANGNFSLGVHIADVSHYVRENSALDQAAISRGTSIYLADRVIPMLPKQLSNGLCSLNPHLDRLTLSCVMEIDAHGKTVAFEVFPSVINSKHRLTYQEVNQFLGGEHQFDQPLSTMLKDAQQLAQIIRTFKTQQGYIDFEIEESKLVLDENGQTINIVPQTRGAAEMLIEDFMVRANETVATLAAQKRVPFLYRVHDKPEAEKLQMLHNVINVLKLEISIPAAPTPKQFAKAINDLKQYRFDDFMKILMLRTMCKATYEQTNIGHFGLASQFYTHFTSPIRRYPDLIVHRMLRVFFFEGDLTKKLHFTQILPMIANSANLSEIRAMELERKVADIKKAEYYTKFIGQVKQGQIVSMQNFGFFVEFKDKVDGLVHLNSLVDGAYSIVGNGFKMSNGKRIFTIGEMISVVIVNTDKESGKIDLCVADLYPQWQLKNQPRTAATNQSQRLKSNAN